MDDVAPYNKLPELNTVCVLIVGSEGVGTHALAKAVVQYRSTGIRKKVKVRTATSLPLPADVDGNRPRIDFVVFVINQASKSSFTHVRNSLSHLDVDFFLGRVLFIMSNCEEPTQAAIETETVSTLAEAYNSHLLFANLKKEHDINTIAEKCCSLMNLAGGFKPMTTLLLQ